MEINQIKTVAIYPPIGIARIGNSPEHFLATDIPGVSVVPPGGFKDPQGRIKKEVARFRVYGFDGDGKVLGEVTADHANISWQVDVANLKPAWYEFVNALDLGTKYAIPATRRKSDVVGGYREFLAIKPSPKTISGTSVADAAHRFDDGKFYDTNVNLGHLETDEAGRLLFFAGDGDARSHNNAPITTFANNNGWHDDTCDGVVRATVQIRGQTLEATPAMVAVTPPNFGQGLYGVVTMNDVVQNLFINEMDYPNPSAAGVEFWRDIFPILERMVNTQWVNEGFYMLFGKNSPSDFTNPAIIDVLKSPAPEHKADRLRVFEWFRDPQSAKWTPEKVPPFYGDGFGDYSRIALDDLPLTEVQYERLQKWAAGDFTTGKPIANVPFDERSAAEQIAALNQASLEDCLGGPFHPGIELTWTMRVKSMWAEPYRLKVLPEGEATQLDFGDVLTPEIALDPVNGPCSVNGPGSLTRWMGVPWQTDEASCLSGYTVSNYLSLPSFWAARVPNQVFSEDSYLRVQAGDVNIAQRLKHFDYRQDWLRDIEADHLKRLNNMVAEWNHLGIITREETPAPNNQEGFLPDVYWVEKGRNFDPGEPDQTFAQVLYAEGHSFVGETVERVDDLDHATLKVSGIQKQRPQSTRKRRTLGRGER